MDFKILNYIVNIAEQKSVTKAANVLYISQSGLNQMLIKEEREVGAKLFYRSKKELVPTQAGKVYIENAKKILKIRNDMMSQIRDQEENPSGTITFGLPFEHGIDMFTTISTEFSIRYPNISINMRERSVANTKEDIKEGKMDIAFIMQKSKPTGPFEAIHLCNEQLLLGIPKTKTIYKEFSNKESLSHQIDLTAFGNEAFALMFSGSTMRDIIDPLFSEAGINPVIKYETLMNRALVKLAAKGLCCTIVPQSYAQDITHIGWFQLKGDVNWNWWIIYSAERYLNSADKYLISLCKTYAEQMEQHWRNFGIGTPDN